MSIPFCAYFNVLTAGASDEIVTIDGEVTSSRRISLILEAEPRTQIVLSAGERLSAVETHVTLVMATESPKFTGELSDGEVGYLIHTEQGVHGAVLWPYQPLPYYLLLPDLKTTVSMGFSSLAAVSESALPYRWRQGREHLLRITSFGIGCTHEHVQLSGDRNV